MYILADIGVFYFVWSGFQISFLFNFVNQEIHNGRRTLVLLSDSQYVQCE